MSKQFKVGQIVVGQEFVYATWRNGDEGTVLLRKGLIQTYCVHTGRHKGVNDIYVVRWSDGHEENVCRENLRPKRPPRRAIDEVVSWETVGWMPFEVKFDRAIKQMLMDQLREKANANQA